MYAPPRRLIRATTSRPEAHGEPELSDADFLVRAVLERLPVVRWVAPRRGYKLIELVEYPVLVGGDSPSRSSSAVEESSHVHSSSLIARAESLAGLLVARRSALTDILLGFKQGDEFVAVERRELDGVSKCVPNKLAPAVESASLPRLAYLFEERLGSLEVHRDDVVIPVVVRGRSGHTDVICWSYQ